MDRPGLFELANGGTLFLDELHTMPMELQAKLLRVLEDGIVRRVGGSKSFSVDVRIMAAMNEHPRKVLAQQKLRSDLFYRLNVLMFDLIPLRERKEDILILTKHFIRFFNTQLGKKIKGITLDVELLFLQYEWPGNVRELKHSLEYMMNMSEGLQLTTHELPIFFKQNIDHKRKAEPRSDNLSLRENLRQLESKLISRALTICSGNINQAAKLLEIPRQTLQYKLQKVDSPPTAE